MGGAVGGAADSESVEGTGVTVEAGGVPGVGRVDETVGKEVHVHAHAHVSFDAATEALQLVL